MLARRFVAEFLGTFILVFLAVGAAVAASLRRSVSTRSAPAPASLGVAIAFGFVLIFVAYAFGPVSGAHINPAVTLGCSSPARSTAETARVHVVAQVCGAIVGAALLKLLVTSARQGPDRSLGSNGYGTTIDMGGAFILEIVLTLVFVLVILLVTDKAATAGAAGLAIGACLTRDPPGRHPADRHLGEPGPLARPGAVRRRRRARPAVAVHRRARWSAGCWRRSSTRSPACPNAPPASTPAESPGAWRRAAGWVSTGSTTEWVSTGSTDELSAGLSRSRSGVRPGRIGPGGAAR